MIIQCCVCKRVRKDASWVTCEELRETDADVSHGYCPQCASEAFKEIRLPKPKPQTAVATRP